MIYIQLKYFCSIDFPFFSSTWSSDTFCVARICSLAMHYRDHFLSFLFGVFYRGFFQSQVRVYFRNFLHAVPTVNVLFTFTWYFLFSKMTQICLLWRRFHFHTTQNLLKYAHFSKGTHALPFWKMPCRYHTQFNLYSKHSNHTIIKINICRGVPIWSTVKPT